MSVVEVRYVHDSMVPLVFSRGIALFMPLWVLHCRAVERLAGIEGDTALNINIHYIDIYIYIYI